MDDFLVAYSIFLRGETVRYRGGILDLCVTAQHGVKAPGSYVQVHVLQTERCIIACGARVLSRAQEEEKGSSDHIGNRLGVFVMRNAVCLRQDVDDDNNRDWFDSFRRRIFTLVGPDLSLDSEIDVPVDVFSDIKVRVTS
jgi:hypothetical protein